MPVYVAALNHKMRQLAREVVDGLVVNTLTREGAKEVRDGLKTGAKRFGRDPSGVGIYALSITLACWRQS